jgi:hypothetical protein
MDAAASRSDLTNHAQLTTPAATINRRATPTRHHTTKAKVKPEAECLLRVGIDVDHPDELVTSGVFAWSRNPIYVGLFLALVGQFLVFPNWVPLVYLAAGTWLVHRQVLREEAFMRRQYGEEYVEYCGRVRRYV